MISIIGKPPTDLQVLQYDLQWYQEEIQNLDRDKRELEAKLYDKEVEIERLTNKISELQAKRSDDLR